MEYDPLLNAKSKAEMRVFQRYHGWHPNLTMLLGLRSLMRADILPIQASDWWQKFYS